MFGYGVGHYAASAALKVVVGAGAIALVGIGTTNMITGHPATVADVSTQTPVTSAPEPSSEAPAPVKTTRAPVSVAVIYVAPKHSAAVSVGTPRATHRVTPAAPTVEPTEAIPTPTHTTAPAEPTPTETTPPPPTPTPSPTRTHHEDGGGD